MRKLLALVLCMPLALAGLARADASGGPLTAGGAPAAQLTDFACVRALAPAGRTLTVTGVMRPVPGTQRMRMRFDLLSAPRRRGRYHVVHGPNLGRWLVPVDPALGSRPDDVWQVPHPISDLEAPAFYKLRVGFRWLGSGGRVIAHQVLVTPVCHQLELRPDLAPQSLTISPATTSGEDDYLGVVRNLGMTGAGPFDVQLSLADGTTVTRHVLWLGPHRSRQLNIVATSCTPGSNVILTADPTASVDDFDRANNALTVICPTG